jgi:rod shape-determining protein MreD
MRVAVRMRSNFAVEVYRINPVVGFTIAVVAILLQGYLPMWFPGTAALDLALLVTIFFSLSRRSQVAGLFIGAAIGLAQDSLGHGPIGMFGITKTIVGYSASSIGARIDTEHPGIRLVVVFVFYYIHQALFLFLQRVLLEKPVALPPLPRLLAVGLVNAILAVLLFQFLDRFKKPA